MDNFSLLYPGETDLSVDLSTMRKEADAIREDEVTSELWQQLVGLKESASDGIETAVRYQRVLGEIHLLQVHYETTRMRTRGIRSLWRRREWTMPR